MDKTTQTILCFGDSNTYGYDPRSFLGDRYPEQIRWTGMLKEKTNMKIINLGMPGREIPHFTYQMEQIKKMIEPYSTPASSGNSDCASQRPSPPLWLWIMLGTNDLLNHDTLSAEDVTDRMGIFLDYLLKQEGFHNGKIKIMLISPPCLQPGTWVNEHARRESLRLGDCMKQLAFQFNLPFANAGKWKIPLCFDGVHLTEEGHRIFANHMIQIFSDL